MAQANQPAFALVPADAAGVVFDYTTREGLEIYKTATRPLYSGDEDRYSVEASGLQTFLGLLVIRSIITSWSLTVPDDINDPNAPSKHLIHQHGEISLDHIRTYAATFVNGNNRLAQENMQMVQAILNSLTLTGFNKVQVWKEDWNINGLPSALLLIKVIIREAFIDTNATTRILREKLSSLPEQLTLLNHDITALNAFVMVTLDQLAARGETSTDLLANLFKGYLSTGDRVFTAYIEKKQEEYDEGSSLTHTQLMEKAANKYKTMVENGTWMAPSLEEKKIVALEAQVQNLQRSARKPQQGIRTQQPPRKGQQGKQQSKGKPQGKGKPKQKAKPVIEEWMTKHPGEEFINRGIPKVVNGKEFWWCKNHKRFVRHTTAQCKLQAQAPGNANTNNNNSSPQFHVSAAVLMEE